MGIATIWLIGAVVAYFVLKSYRSSSPVVFALVWPIGLLVLAVGRLTSRQQRVKSTPDVALPPPPPRYGMIETAARDDDRGPGALG